ncbi:ATP-binding protein [Archangium sp.]|uniref:ATP-binding protein n=1 Tax=Archangium sp. TaxID=1872627 RepID=UPI002D679236|nr:ATP-binding protein [Archangium sp.]HYO51486.1 ATP-binding protein [Archangium sp.]
MRSMEWSKTSLGTPDDWPQSLRSALSICLGSRFPIALYWGPRLALLYNDAWSPIPGGKHPWALGRGAQEVWPEIWDTIGPLFEQVMTTGEATYSEHGLLPMHRHGYTEECYFNFTFSPIRGEGGRVEGVFNAVMETTYQVISERRTRVLRELGERTAAARSAEEACALAASSLGSEPHDVPFCALYLVDEEAQVARLAASSGLSHGGPAAPELTPLAEETGARWPFARVRSSGRVEVVSGLSERFGCSLPGGPWPEPASSALVAPILTATAGRASGFLVIGVSPRRAVDEEYRQFAERAASHVATVLSSATAYEAERKRAEALAEIDRAKTAFFSNVSHEFRTPLTLMLGPVEDSLADAEHPLPPEQRERQLLVRRNALRLQKLVNTLLDFARIEAGRAQASFVPTDLAALTRDLASSFDSALKSAGLGFLVDCAPLPEAVYVDPAMWEKIVLNLLSNAFKFTFKGEIRVALKWLGDRVELTVQDTGTGIPEEELPLIFERFHQVEGARGRSHEGTGIGLALVRELVKLHGGKVDVKSALGKGTTFTVSLPTGSSHLPKAHVGVVRTLAPTGIGPSSFLAEVSQWNDASVSRPAHAAPSALRAGARILVADDNTDMRDYLSRLLSPHWTVEVVSDGAQALAAARTHPPDLILSDVMMPGMDGLELVQALRADERTRTIPVILLSARAGEEATIEGLKSGADEYLVKPFSANELLARVNAQLTVSHLRQEAVRAERAHADEANRLLEESRRATRSREETLAVVSHDLRSPLSTITTAAELLQRALGEDERGARLRKYTDSIRRSASRMNRLIADLLDLASIDTGTLSIEPRPHTAEELVREVQEMFELQTKEKGLQFTSESEPALPVLSCDKERILQVLANLLSNALKFTVQGGINVRARRHPEGILFSVSDTGAGIAPEALPHVFDRYWHSTQKGHESHGLGLSIVQGIVEAHGGTLHVESEPGRGSTFSFLLPTNPAARSTSAGPSEVTRASTPQAARNSSSTYDFLAGGGEMGKLIRAMDWSKTPLGPVESWPQSLRTTVSLCVASNFPISVAWGPQHIQIYNDGYWPICGGKHPHSMGQDFTECWASAWPAVGEAFERALAGETQYIENRRMFLDRNGYLEETFFTFSFSPIRDETGGVGGLFHPVTETTSKMLSERRTRALRDLAARTGKAKTLDDAFTLAAQTLADDELDLPFVLFYALDAEGRYARLAGSMGLTAGTSAAPELIELDSGAFIWPIAEVARSGASLQLDDVAPRLGATKCGPYPELPKVALILPLSLPGAERPAAAIVAGVSSRLPLTEVYRGFYDLVASTVTAAIANARAYEEERRRAEALAEVDRAKTAFFSNVSHEFRTPLTLILGPVEDALSRTKKALEGEKLELVRRNALRLYKMVNTLLDFSRMEAGRAQATFVPTNLSAFTADLASAFRSVVESAGLELRVDCPPLPEAVYVDPEMWEKIVLNLLSNAVKYTYQGEIGVNLRWEDESAVLTVRDTGVGIPEEELPRVFERFYRVRVTQGRSHEGTGIGLALVQELAKLHGGSVAVASKLGQGTTFTVRMPRGSAHLPSERVERTPRPRSSASSAAFFIEEARRWSPDAQGADEPGPRASDDEAFQVPAEIVSSRILLVDDNADLRSYVSGLLGRAFPNVETAVNGQEALQRVHAQPPDLILSDVMMPGLDGFGLVRELRADQRTRAIPIILLSARAGDESTVEGLRSGADDYLVKPFSARELFARVRTQLEMARVRREVAHHELAEEQLRWAVKARDEWLTVVSHELRTPLSALTLSVQSLIRSVASEERAELPPETMRTKAHTVEKHLHRLTRQVEQLVDMSELVSGRLKLTPEEVDLSAVVAAVVEKAREKAARTGCAVISSTSAPVVGRYDRARLHQLVESLLDNALKFGAGKPVEVAVVKEAGHASIRIVDHGGGVALEDQERIFGRFERAAPTRNYGGFGLGLWMARHIAEAHAGSIHLTRTEGGGATFTVALPLDVPALD